MRYSQSFVNHSCPDTPTTINYCLIAKVTSKRVVESIEVERTRQENENERQKKFSDSTILS